MPDFKKALEEGFEAARKANDARKEIDEVFEELNAQVLESTGDKVSIGRRQVRDDSVTTEATTASFKIMGLGIAGPPSLSHWAIVALNPSVDGGKIFELARWAMDKAGYPCTVTWNKQDHTCEDKEALINCLSDLLKDPAVGQTLYTLTKLKPTKKG